MSTWDCQADDGVSWWPYDATTTALFNAARAAGNASVAFAMRGSTYDVDFATMVQVPSKSTYTLNHTPPLQHTNTCAHPV